MTYFSGVHFYMKIINNGDSCSPSPFPLIWLLQEYCIHLILYQCLKVNPIEQLESQF